MMWHFAECAVQGRGHIKSGVPCQDKTKVLHKNNVFVIALADGAGSASHSHFGAEMITNSVSELLCSKFDEYFSAENASLVTKDICLHYIDELVQLSSQLECKINALASTLLFVAVKDGRFILGHIGDGVIGYLKNEQLKIASFPNNGEFSNETVFTTSSNAHVHMNLIKGNLNGISSFILMSDGTAESLYLRSKKQLANVIKTLMDLSTLIPKEKFDELLSKSFINSVSQATTDDCSMALMTLDAQECLGFMHASENKKYRILKLKGKDSRLRLKRYSNLLEFMGDPRTVKEIQQFCVGLYIRKKYVEKHISRLMSLSLIEYNNGQYSTLIRL